MIRDLSYISAILGTLPWRTTAGFLECHILLSEAARGRDTGLPTCVQALNTAQTRTIYLCLYMSFWALICFLAVISIWDPVLTVSTAG